MMRVEISLKMERLSELLIRSPNHLEDIRDLCLELATDIDQHLQEVEDETYDQYEDDDDSDGEEYDPEEDERYQEYQYRYGEDDD
ncbi:hypothetical protein CSB45_08515 [candidate division KSB3 bacterium]|uniref:Uncharacterized protein n=1 Tax=candidate division KSB3 bacterium TaxID=2044937 RepID=A0A2G6E589_9BACT|nr:MAG: hypothetical protein CSB45_08515 [candidate division KSB3 bacterium]PIE29739.1 MAG: hypothetical protein CSA57_06700 [candidate division KSB3 bacterium]